MFKIFNRKLKRGNLVDITLTAEARRHIDGYDWYAKDNLGETNEPGRVVSGRVMEVEIHYVFVAQVWNEQKNEPVNGRVKVYRDAIQSIIRRNNPFILIKYK